MKKIISFILAVFMLLSLTACAKPADDDTPSPAETSGSDAAQSGGKWDYSSVQTEAPKDLTLDDAQVRLIYFNDPGNGKNPYLLVAYHGPWEGVYASFVGTDGMAIADAYYMEFESGWCFLQTEELPEGTTLDDVGVYVTDHVTERIFTDFGEALTDQELEGIGAVFLGGKLCAFSTDNRLSATRSEATFTVYVQVYRQESIPVSDLPFDISDFQFFAGDGTPLSEYADGYEYSVEVDKDSRDKLKGILVRFAETVDHDIDENDAFCQMLRTLDVYMTYTAADGTTTRYDNILIDPQ